MKLQLTRPEATAFDPKQALAALGFAMLAKGIEKTELMMAGESRRARWRFLLSPERGQRERVCDCHKRRTRGLSFGC